MVFASLLCIICDFQGPVLIDVCTVPHFSEALFIPGANLRHDLFHSIIVSTFLDRSRHFKDVL